MGVHSTAERVKSRNLVDEGGSIEFSIDSRRTGMNVRKREGLRMFERIARIDRIEKDVDSSICIKISHRCVHCCLQVIGCGLFVLFILLLLLPYTVVRNCTERHATFHLRSRVRK